MNRYGALAFLLIVFVFCFALVPFAQAALPQGMTQGEFALWLVKEAGAIRQLPAAASASDAIDFLRKIGVAPKDGWDPDKEVDSAFLASFLEGDQGSLSIDDLLKRITELVEERFNNANPAVFRVASASGATPA